MRADGTFYILDTENKRIRRVDTNGIMSTVVTNADAANEGRGLWVNNDESLIYFCALTCGLGAVKSPFLDLTLFFPDG